MNNIPEFMPVLLNICSPHNHKELVLRGIITPRAKEVRRERGQQVTMTDVRHHGYIFSYMQIFKHDEKEEFYVAEYPRMRFYKGDRQVLIPRHITIGNVPEDTTTNDLFQRHLTLVVHKMLFKGEKNQKIVKSYTSEMPHIVLDPKLYGPMDLEEVLSQRALNYVFL